MAHKRAVFLSIVMLSAYGLCAQSNQAIDTLLGQEKATFAETAYLVLIGGGWISEDSNTTAAFNFAVEKKWIPITAEPGTAVDLTSFSLLAMKGLRIKGGIVWKILPIKRYAYREMLAQGIINASGGTKRVPSGEEVVRMIGEAADLPRRAQ